MLERSRLVRLCCVAEIPIYRGPVKFFEEDERSGFNWRSPTPDPWSLTPAFFIGFI